MRLSSRTDTQASRNGPPSRSKTELTEASMLFRRASLTKWCVRRQVTMNTIASANIDAPREVISTVTFVRNGSIRCGVDVLTPRGIRFSGKSGGRKNHWGTYGTSAGEEGLIPQPIGKEKGIISTLTVINYGTEPRTQ